MALLLLSRTCNAPILRIGVLKQVSRKEILRTFARRHPVKKQARTPPTNKPVEIYKRTSLFSRVYHGFILRVKIHNLQIFRTFKYKLVALRTRISHKHILKEQVVASGKSKVAEINNMVSLIFNKISTVLMLRFEILQQISPQRIFRFLSAKLVALRSRISHKRIAKEHALTSTKAELVGINKLASSLFRRIYNRLTYRLKVLKQVLRKQIFGSLTYESPISALRTSRYQYYNRTNTNKHPNIDKGALTIGSVGIGTLFIYQLGLLNQPDNVKMYVYFGCSLAVAVASAMAALHSPVMYILTRKGSMTQVINMLAIIITGVVAQNIEYTAGFGFKQLAWLVYASMVGIMFAPILIGPLAKRAMHTTGVFVGLYVTSKCAPKETGYDPINEALSIFMEILNIFIRIAGMFAKVANKNK